MSDFREGDKIVFVDGGKSIFQGVFVGHGKDHISINCGNGPFFTKEEYIYHDSDGSMFGKVTNFMEGYEKKPTRLVTRWFNVFEDPTNGKTWRGYETKEEALHAQGFNRVSYIKYVGIAIELEVDEEISISED